jgi:hypothetical protein
LRSSIDFAENHPPSVRHNLAFMDASLLSNPNLLSIRGLSPRERTPENFHH